MTHAEIEDRLLLLPGLVKELEFAIIATDEALGSRPKPEGWEAMIHDRKRLAAAKACLVSEDRNLRAILYGRSGSCDLVRGVFRAERGFRPLDMREEDHE